MNNDNPIEGTSPPDAVTQESAGNDGGAIERADRRDVLAPFITVAAWIVPGLGHLLLGRWGRALIFLLTVGGLAITGYLLRGNVFPPHAGEPFGTLGFLADAGSGIFYFLSRFFESAGPNVSRAAGDYGTRFIAAAGIVNLLSAFDAYEIALGRRTM
ncbi:MAG TPA: DUF6677 family protein [Candidatus Sulfotelmatobacter sp.]|nr:DUF6677 family protein [Candidatus Sulfotelmatobacter sp.]